MSGTMSQRWAEPTIDLTRDTVATLYIVSWVMGRDELGREPVRVKTFDSNTAAVEFVNNPIGGLASPAMAGTRWHINRFRVNQDGTAATSAVQFGTSEPQPSGSKPTLSAMADWMSDGQPDDPAAFQQDGPGLFGNDAAVNGTD